MKKLLFISIGVLIAVLTISALGIGSSKINKSRIKPSPTSTPTPASSKKSGETKEIQIIATEYSFSPSEITINRGDSVVITLRNTGKMPHNLIFEALNLATKTVLSGQSDTIEFTATESGKSKFYCSVANHKALGMEGDLEVR